MNIFVAVMLLGIFVLLMIGAIMAVASSLGKRHHHAKEGGVKSGKKSKSR